MVLFPCEVDFPCFGGIGLIEGNVYVLVCVSSPPLVVTSDLGEVISINDWMRVIEYFVPSSKEYLYSIFYPLLVLKLKLRQKCLRIINNKILCYVINTFCKIQII